MNIYEMSREELLNEIRFLRDRIEYLESQKCNCCGMDSPTMLMSYESLGDEFQAVLNKTPYAE